jgi:hypothetical protein
MGLHGGHVNPAECPLQIRLTTEEEKRREGQAFNRLDKRRRRGKSPFDVTIRCSIKEAMRRAMTGLAILFRVRVMREEWRASRDILEFG